MATNEIKGDFVDKRLSGDGYGASLKIRHRQEEETEFQRWLKTEIKKADKKTALESGKDGDKPVEQFNMEKVSQEVSFNNLPSNHLNPKEKSTGEDIPKLMVAHLKGATSCRTTPSRFDLVITRPTTPVSGVEKTLPTEAGRTVTETGFMFEKTGLDVFKPYLVSVVVREGVVKVRLRDYSLSLPEVEQVVKEIKRQLVIEGHQFVEIVMNGHVYK